MGTALAHYAYPEESDMESEKTPALTVQVAELSRDVQHAQSDIKDIKADIREIKTDIKALHAKFDAKIEKLNDKFDQLKDSFASAKIWAIGMYVTLAGSMLYVIAKSAKWF